jgi:DNA invertase Pin-like site-specific DNA recombinase
VRTAIYTRISDDHTGEALGVRRQLADCEALADRLGWEVVERYDDNDISAFSGKRRPGFEAMLEAMKAGEFGALICWHPDRLYRSMRDLERVIEIADERGVQLRTVTAGDLNLGTPAGRMLARILGSVARQEVEHKGERQRRANEQRRAAGRWVRTGLRKFAYTKDGKPHEPEASELRKAAADVLAGKSLRGIAIDWNERGVKTTRGNKFTSLQVRRTLINPLYAGLVTHNDKVVGRGEWQPIIDEATHHGLVAYLSDPARRPAVSFERRHMLSGVATCGICSQALYAVQPGAERGIVYTCRPSAHVARSGALLDEYVDALVVAWFSQPKTRKRLSALLNGGRDVDVNALQSQRDALQARMDSLARMHVAGDIDDSQLRSGTAEHRTQRDAIDKVLAKAARRSPAAGMLAADDPRAHWDGCSPDLRGKIVDEIMTITVLPAPRGPWFRDRANPTTEDWERFAEYLDVKPRVAQ